MYQLYSHLCLVIGCFTILNVSLSLLNHGIYAITCSYNWTLQNTIICTNYQRSYWELENWGRFAPKLRIMKTTNHEAPKQLTELTGLLEYRFSPEGMPNVTKDWIRYLMQWSKLWTLTKVSSLKIDDTGSAQSTSYNKFIIYQNQKLKPHKDAWRYLRLMTLFLHEISKA